VGFLGEFGRALGESVRNFREELTDTEDGKPATSSSDKPRESVPVQVGTALRKGRDALGLDGMRSDVQHIRTELGDFKRSVDSEREGLRDSLTGQPNARTAPGDVRETPADQSASASD
jgi:Sec-independent protein translocase protein TatA